MLLLVGHTQSRECQKATGNQSAMSRRPDRRRLCARTDGRGVRARRVLATSPCLPGRCWAAVGGLKLTASGPHLPEASSLVGSCGSATVLSAVAAPAGHPPGATVTLPVPTGVLRVQVRLPACQRAPVAGLPLCLPLCQLESSKF
jgi:hypothetical protein